MPKTLLQFIAEAEEDLKKKFPHHDYCNIRNNLGSVCDCHVLSYKLFLSTSLTELAHSFAESVRLEKIKDKQCSCGCKQMNQLGTFNQAIDELNAKITTFLSEGVKSTKQDS